MCVTTCPCCARPPSFLAELHTADGAIHPKLVAIRPEQRHQPYRTIIAPQGVYMTGETLEPTAPAFQERSYRWNGKTRRDERALTDVLIFEEEVREPVKPKQYICNTRPGTWCNECRTGHSSVAPRIVNRRG